MNITHTIQKTALFQGMDDKTLEELVTHCHKKTYSKGQQIFETGDKAESFFIILTGWVKLFRISRDGDEAIIHIFGPGESFAEAAVFRDQRSYPVNAQAVSKVDLVTIPRSFFIHKIEEDSQFALRILASISTRQHHLVGQLEQVTTRTAPQRIGAFLLQFCQRIHTQDGTLIIDLPYDKSLISNRLNIKPETFSRAISKLEPYGIKSDGRRVIIHEPKTLAEFCDVELPEPKPPCHLDA